MSTTDEVRPRHTSNWSPRLGITKTDDYQKRYGMGPFYLFDPDEDGVLAEDDEGNVLKDKSGNSVRFPHGTFTI